MDPQAMERREDEMGGGKGHLERLPDAGQNAKSLGPQKLAISLRLHDQKLRGGHDPEKRIPVFGEDHAQLECWSDN
jgi:hypothetical protein